MTSVLRHIFGHALDAGDRTAVVHNGRPVSYRRFAGAVALAREHLAAHVQPGRIAVGCMGNLVETWIVRLALRSLGATTLSLRAPDDLKLLGLDGLLIVAETTEAGPWTGLGEAARTQGHDLVRMPTNAYAGWEGADLKACADAIERTPSGGHILLTSGTTGGYKKVLYDPVADEQVVSLLSGPAGITAVTNFNLFNFPGWTVAAYTWAVLAWRAGGTVNFHQGPDRWRSMLDLSLTHAVVTPQMLSEVLASPAETPLRNPGLRLFVVGGGLSVSLWQAAKARLTPNVWSVYGSTESGHKAFTELLRVSDLNAHDVGQAGAIQVVGEDDRPVPPGLSGAVRLKTTGIDGYLGDPEASRAFFRGGYFYPGDLGAIREDGRLVLQGRDADVINVMGAKVATLPIETALVEGFGLAGACLFSRPGAGGEEVCLAVELAGSIDEPALQSALAAALPSLGQVSMFRVTALPRNTMGKVERVKLKAMLAG